MESDYLAGRLLVATPQIGEGVFHRSVILMLHHDADGAQGVVLNRPMEAPVDAVLPAWQEHVTPPGVLFEGGPVGLDTALGLLTVPGGGEEPDAGWSPGQLEDEVGTGSWYVVDAEARDAFSDHPDDLWVRVLRRQRDHLAFVSTFPADPEMN